MATSKDTKVWRNVDDEPVMKLGPGEYDDRQIAQLNASLPEVPQARLAHFELAGKEGGWQPASAVIKDRTVKVTSETSIDSPIIILALPRMPTV